MARGVQMSEPEAVAASELNARCIAALYGALERRDAAAAADCYAGDAVFEDIGFRLRGREAIARMWEMVCAADGFRAEHDPQRIEADAARGKGVWVAHYAPLVAGSGYDEVRNPSSSTFRFVEPGLISGHLDAADAGAWAEMAFPAPLSLVMGNLGFVRRAFARAKLARFSRRGR